MASVAHSITTLVYDGESNPVDFIRQFKIHALCLDWDEDKCITSIPLFLKEKASRVFAGINPKTTSAQIYAGIIAGCSQPVELSLYQFYERKRRPGESVSKFARALQELLLKAVPTLNDTPDVANQFLRPQLCLNLPQHMRAMVQFNSTMTWEQLLACLDRSLPHVVDLTTENQYVNESYSRWDSYSPAQAQADNAQYQTPHIKTEQADATYAHTQKQPKITSQFSQQQPYTPTRRFNGTCFYCNLVGHQEWECRWRLQNIKDGIILKTNHKPPRTQPAGRQPVADNNNVNAEQKQGLKSDEYSFFAENHTIETISLNHSGSEALMKIETELTCLDGSPIKASVLIDGGSSRSFLAPKLLSTTQLRICNNPSNEQAKFCKRQRFDITGATGTSKSECCIVTTEVNINGWLKSHEFVISGAVNKHDAILGRDFLVKHKLKVDHANDALFSADDGVICSRTLESFNTFIFQSDKNPSLADLKITNDDELAIKVEQLQTQLIELSNQKSTLTSDPD